MSIKIAQAYDVRKIHVGRIAYGEDIHESLIAYCTAHNIQTAWLNVLGALSEATLAYYEQDNHKYVTSPLTGEYEILNGTGNISLKDGKPFGHIHLTLSDTQFGCTGGHLMPGTVKVFACEFVLFEGVGAEPLCRLDADPETGLALW